MDNKNKQENKQGEYMDEPTPEQDEYGFFRTYCGLKKDLKWDKNKIANHLNIDRSYLDQLIEKFDPNEIL